MSLFSGMKLAGSSVGQSTGKKVEAIKEAGKDAEGNPSSTGRDDESANLTSEEPSAFSFIPSIRGSSSLTVEKGGDSFTDATSKEGPGVSALDEPLPGPGKPLLPIDGLAGDPHSDLDPIKVIVDASGVGHRAGFDLRDLDFSQPRDLVSDDASVEPADEEASPMKSASCFGFVAGECAPSSAPDEAGDPVRGPSVQDAPRAPDSAEEDDSVKGGDSNEREETARPQAVGPKPSLSKRLQVCQSEFAQKLLSIKKSSSDVTAQMRQLAQDCIISWREVLVKQQQLQLLQQQQQQAVDVEDYDKAEELQLQCQGLEEEIQTTDSLLPSTHPSLRPLIASLRSLSNQERACRRQAVEAYRGLIAEQTLAVADSRGRCSRLENGRLRSIQEERGKLSRDFGHLQLDKEHLQMRETNLRSQIDEKTVDLRHARDSLITEREQVQDEIEILEAKLSALRHRESDISDSILVKDREIEAASGDFDAEKSSIEMEEGSLREAEAELTAKGEKLDEEEGKLAREVDEMEAGEASQVRVLADLEELLAAEIETEAELDNGDIEGLSGLCPEELKMTLPDTSADFLKAKAEVDQMRDGIRTATSGLLQRQTKVAVLRQRVSDTEGHIAALTETKQLAVSGRTFSEAKRLSEEIKRLTEEGRSIQGEVEELRGQNERESEALARLRGELERKQQEVEEEERRHELTAKDRLLEHMAECREQMEATPRRRPFSLLVQRAELLSSSLKVRFLCRKHQLTPPAEAEDSWAEDGREPLDSAADGPGEGWPRERQMEKMKTEVEELEAQLQEAVESEDYDQAELLQGGIDRVQGEMKRLGAAR